MQENPAVSRKAVEFDTQFDNSKVKHLKIPNIAAVSKLGAAFSYGAIKSSEIKIK